MPLIDHSLFDFSKSDDVNIYNVEKSYTAIPETVSSTKSTRLCYADFIKGSSTSSPLQQHIPRYLRDKHYCRKNSGHKAKNSRHRKSSQTLRKRKSVSHKRDTEKDYYRKRNINIQSVQCNQYTVDKDNSRQFFNDNPSHSNPLFVKIFPPPNEHVESFNPSGSLGESECGVIIKQCDDLLDTTSFGSDVNCNERANVHVTKHVRELFKRLTHKKIVQKLQKCIEQRAARKKEKEKRRKMSGNTNNSPSTSSSERLTFRYGNIRRPACDSVATASDQGTRVHIPSRIRRQSVLSKDVFAGFVPPSSSSSTVSASSCAPSLSSSVTQCAPSLSTSLMPSMMSVEPPQQQRDSAAAFTDTTIFLQKAEDSIHGTGDSNTEDTDASSRKQQAAAMLTAATANRRASTEILQPWKSTARSKDGSK